MTEANPFQALFRLAQDQAHFEVAVRRPNSYFGSSGAGLEAAMARREEVAQDIASVKFLVETLVRISEIKSDPGVMLSRSLAVQALYRIGVLDSAPELIRNHREPMPVWAMKAYARQKGWSAENLMWREARLRYELFNPFGNPAVVDFEGHGPEPVRIVRNSQGYALEIYSLFKGMWVEMKRFPGAEEARGEAERSAKSWHPRPSKEDLVGAWAAEVGDERLHQLTLDERIEVLREAFPTPDALVAFHQDVRNLSWRNGRGKGPWEDAGLIAGASSQGWAVPQWMDGDMAVLAEGVLAPLRAEVVAVTELARAGGASGWGVGMVA